LIINTFMKTISVGNKTWKKLQKIKLNSDFKTLGKVIDYLISLQKKGEKK